MSGFLSLGYLLPELWRTLFARRITVGYPFTPLDLPSHYRGKVVIDMEECRGCELCVRDCPADALELERDSDDSLRLIYHQDRCAYCGQCERSCPTKAIVLTNEFVRATADRRTLREEFAKDGED